MTEEHDGVKLFLLGMLAGGIIWMIVLLSLESKQRAKSVEAAHIEVCSYSCNLKHGRWPDKVEWDGRDKRDQAVCRCFYAEQPQEK